ncbi:MAG: hypothetical protein AB2L09_00565 [Coriobacteriia bacterium]
MRVRLWLVLIGSAVLLLSGCSRFAITYVDAKAHYTNQTIESVYDHVDSSQVSGLQDPNVDELRHDALTSLRSKGARAVEAADLITSSFASDTRGVPLYVEWSTFNGSDALVLVEATGPNGGQLTTLRLWVLSPTGEVELADWK